MRHGWPAVCAADATVMRPTSLLALPRAFVTSPQVTPPSVLRQMWPVLFDRSTEVSTQAVVPA